jgi:hypothetical protein
MAIEKGANLVVNVVVVEDDASCLVMFPSLRSPMG